MSWSKKGLILTPSENHFWLRGGAGNCFAVVEDGNLQLIVSGRDDQNRSRLGKVRLNAKTYEVLEIAAEPLLALGEKGVFDYNGTSYPWLVKRERDSYLYYTGWTIGHHVAFINDLGLACANGDSAFKKISRASIFPRTDLEPFGTGSVCVINEENKWKMWYTTFTKWGDEATEKKHYYHIRYAESEDGINWNRDGKVCIDFDESKGEYVAAKPCVIMYKGLYLMWYSYRGEYYKIGFAVSRNGVNWTRHDEMLIMDVSETGWDSEMVCYGFVFFNNNQLEMLYTGNGFGRSGLGLATMPIEELDTALKTLGYLND